MFGDATVRSMRRAGLAAVSVMALLVGAGCQSAATAPAAGNAGGAAQATDAPVQPKVNRLVWAIKSPPAESSNPRMICCFDSFQYRPTHENMMIMDAETGKLVPGLSTDWKIDLTANTVTFNLRSGVNFQEPDKWGQMTADDVKWSYESLIAPSDPPSNNTWIQSFWKPTVQDVKVTSPTQVVFSIKPHINFMYFMSDSASQMSVRSQKQQAAEPEPKTLEQKPPVGTGGYQWTERKSGSYIRFKRVEYKHWNKTPEFPEFEFRFMNEPSTRLAGLLANEVHVTDLPSDLSPQAEKSGMKLIPNRLPAPRVWGQWKCCYVDPQTKQFPMYPDAPLLKKPVREALNRAINRAELTKAFAPKSTPMFVNHFNKSRQAWDDRYEKQFNERYGFDPAKAKDLLAQAGYTAANPLKIQIMLAPLTYIAAGPDIAESIGQYWRAVGVQPEMVQMDPATETAQNRAYKFNNMLRLQSASAVQPYGINIFSSGANPPGGGYWTPQFMDKINELNGAMDEKKQDELLKWIGDFGYDEYWDIPLWYVPLEVAVNPQIVSDYAFPGQVDGGFSHFYTLKAAK